jgi:isochorismate synthase
MSLPGPASASTRLGTLVADARTRARATGTRVLVSIVERAPVLDPLAAVEALGHPSPGRDAAMMSDRMYWTRPSEAFSLAGFGSVITLEERGVDRFPAMDRGWAELRDGALVDDPSAGERGVGPLVMGGFAFEPDGPRTDRWRDFPAARLFVPRVHLTVVGEICWVTASLLVESSGDADIEPSALIALRRRVVDAATSRRRTPSGVASTATLAPVDARPAPAWGAAVNAAVTEIRAGALEKVVLAREVRLAAPRDFDVVETVRQLRSAHQASYVFAYWHGGSAFVGASPELLVSLDGREVHASSLAGSVRRGATPASDAALASELLASAKDLVEHEVVRRALQEGLAEMCDDVVADDEPSLLSLPQVHHLYTDVRGVLRDGGSLLGVAGHLHPTPAVGGAPRDAALHFIREHEGIDRGWYAGPIGWVQPERGELAVALRSALITRNEASLFAGCGIVADSDPDAEYAESLLKLQPMEMALAASVVVKTADPPIRAAAGGTKR